MYYIDFSIPLTGQKKDMLRYAPAGLSRNLVLPLVGSKLRSWLSARARKACSYFLTFIKMGQYHYLVNFDRKEVVHPHKLGLGAKQIEHTHCVASLADVLYMLVVTSPHRGGGDLHYDDALESEFKTFGRWVGDRVAVFGDYTENSDLSSMRDLPNDYASKVLKDGFETDITNQIIPAFEKAFDVSISDTEYGDYRVRKLTEKWDWLFPPGDE